MRSNSFDQFIEERITVLTEGEKIEGRMYHMGGTRLSDFLNSPIQSEHKFLKIKEPTVWCRRTGDVLMQVPFLMLAHSRIVMVMTHAQADPDGPDQDDLSSRDAFLRPF